MTNDWSSSDTPPSGAAAGIGPRPEVDPRAASWRTATATIPLDRPRVMGVLNLTADSFWEGSRLGGVEQALRRASEMVEAGADLLDVGGESTRPGARAVPATEEAARVVPVVRALSREWPDVPVSVDTVKSTVAVEALEAGAAIINDVSGLRLDPALARVAADAGAGIVLMHSRGGVEEMARYELATYGEDPVAEIVAELAGALDRASGSGVDPASVVLDPGLGFSKRTDHSAATLRGLDRFLALGCPVLIGPSRKRFVGDLAGGLPVEERLPGTIAACIIALLRGARIFRVHDVAPVRQALDVAEAVAC